eukprot:gene26857-33503_t
MIAIKKLNKWYGQFQVLTDCSTEDCSKEEFFGAPRSERAKDFLARIIH